MADQPPRRSTVQASVFSKIAARVQPRMQNYWRHVELGMDGGRDMGTFAGQSDPIRGPGSTNSRMPRQGESPSHGSQQAPSSPRSVASPNTYDVGRPIYIGGAGEGYKILGMDFSSNVEPYLQRNPANFYTHWKIGRSEKRSAELMKPANLSS